MIEIAEKPHSICGPSSFERVEGCTASAILGSGLEPVPASAYAAEGTMMHEVWARCLLEDMDAFEFIGEQFKVGEEVMVFDGPMADAVHVGVMFMREFKGDKWIEERVGLPGDLIWGWLDGLIIDKPLVVVDMKFGSGVEVKAETTQTGLYGLMAGLELYGAGWIEVGDPDEVLVNSVICQPRGRERALKPHPWTRAALTDLWVRSAGVAREVRAKHMRYRVSDNCRWCPAVGMCPALRLAAKDAVMLSVVSDPEVVEDVGFTGEALDEAVRLLPALDLWAKRTAELAMRYMEAGGKLINAKLVQKRAIRHWIDEDKTRSWLEEHGVRPWQEPKLLSPNMAEDKLTKDLRLHMAELVEKRSSGLTMASADDPRPAVPVVGPVILKAGLAQATARRILNRATKEPST